VLPAFFSDPGAAETAHRLESEADRLAAALAEASDGTLGPADNVARVLREVGCSFLNYRVVATREAEQRAEMASVPDVVATVPYFETDIYDLAGLLRLGSAVWR
jgi:hypothetical protein